MKKEVLKTKIKKKFGSLSNFARVAGIDRYSLQKTFARKEIPSEERAVLEKAYQDLDGKPTGNVIDPDKLALLRAKIDEVGGRYQFCKLNPDFNIREVYYVYSGERVRLSKLVQRLFDHFNIE
jgi:hypothetical protein